MQRRKFSQDFKEKSIKEAIEVGNTSMVARKYDINPIVMNLWIGNGKKKTEKMRLGNRILSNSMISRDIKSSSLKLGVDPMKRVLL